MALRPVLLGFIPLGGQNVSEQIYYQSDELGFFLCATALISRCPQITNVKFTLLQCCQKVFLMSFLNIYNAEMSVNITLSSFMRISFLKR